MDVYIDIYSVGRTTWVFQDLDCLLTADGTKAQRRRHASLETARNEYAVELQSKMTAGNAKLWTKSARRCQM